MGNCMMCGSLENCMRCERRGSLVTAKPSYQSKTRGKRSCMRCGRRGSLETVKPLSQSKTRGRRQRVNLMRQRDNLTR